MCQDRSASVASRMCVRMQRPWTLVPPTPQPTLTKLRAVVKNFGGACENARFHLGATNAPTTTLPNISLNTQLFPSLGGCKSSNISQLHLHCTAVTSQAGFSPRHNRSIIFCQCEGRGKATGPNPMEAVGTCVRSGGRCVVNFWVATKMQQFDLSSCHDCQLNNSFEKAEQLQRRPAIEDCGSKLVWEMRCVCTWDIISNFGKEPVLAANLTMPVTVSPSCKMSWPKNHKHEHKNILWCDSACFLEELYIPPWLFQGKAQISQM